MKGIIQSTIARQARYPPCDPFDFVDDFSRSLDDTDAILRNARDACQRALHLDLDEISMQLSRYCDVSCRKSEISLSVIAYPC